ncbi:hypothetical protein F2P81_003008 [Scophthalmus maximus]|uniref:Uncharacterized protein n=1 Tax=Scophthalmus maximus TaxID=52904 RepID=A0A6A4TJL8_SCOMX|nr:hypothetical protein F2P81_003008 [Scophthalmus maximus]
MSAHELLHVGRDDRTDIHSVERSCGTWDASKTTTVSLCSFQEIEKKKKKKKQVRLVGVQMSVAVRPRGPVCPPPPCPRLPRLRRRPNQNVPGDWRRLLTVTVNSWRPRQRKEKMRSVGERGRKSGNDDMFACDQTRARKATRKIAPRPVGVNAPSEQRDVLCSRETLKHGSRRAGKPTCHFKMPEEPEEPEEPTEQRVDKDVDVDADVRTKNTEENVILTHIAGVFTCRRGLVLMCSGSLRMPFALLPPLNFSSAFTLKRIVKDKDTSRLPWSRCAKTMQNDSQLSGPSLG